MLITMYTFRNYSTFRLFKQSGCFKLVLIDLHVCTVHQQYQSTFLLLQTDAHNYKIIGILKQLKFRLSLRHVSVHAGTIIRELLRA